jgi:N-acetylneuraminic acid mutarotase
MRQVPTRSRLPRRPPLALALALPAALLACDGGSPAPPPPDAAPSGGPDGAPSAATWQALAPLPASRQEHGVAVLRGRLFVVGGLAPNGTRVEAYDPTTDRWTSHEPLPLRVDHPNIAAAGDKLYLLGSAQDRNTYVYDPFGPDAALGWIQRQPAPVPRAAAAVGVIGDRIFLAGGFGGAVYNGTELQIYDPARDTWQSSSRGEVPPLPVGRNHVPGAVLDGLLYVLGGREGGTRDGLHSRVDVYDPVARAWSVRAAMPTARGGAAAGVVGGRIVVTGGEGNAADPKGIFPQTEIYDPARDSWTVSTPMRIPRHGMGAAGIGDRLYVPAGGTLEGGGEPVAVMEALVP